MKKTMSAQQHLDAVPEGIKFTLNCGSTIERRGNYVYLDDKPMRPGSYFGCISRKDYQRRSAELTNLKKIENSRNRLLVAIAELSSQGERITVSAISRKSGITRQGIYRCHSDLLPRR